MFRSVLAEVAEGIRSTAEGDLRDLIRAARLPTPLFNASLYISCFAVMRRLRAMLPGRLWFARVWGGRGNPWKCWR